MRGMIGVVAGALFAVALGFGGVAAQRAEEVGVEVPLRVEAGRIVVTAQNASGQDLDFVLGAARNVLSEWGASQIGDSRDVTLGGLPMNFGTAQVVPADQVLMDGGILEGPFAGILGGPALSEYDILIDVPNQRLLLKRPGRFVAWDGVSLSNPTRLQILHDALIRTEVEVNGEVFFAHVELTSASMIVSSVVRERASVTGGEADFRLGYAAFPELPAEFIDLPQLRGWGGDDAGVVFVGAPVAMKCAIAISWVHAELRTCMG